MYRYSRLEINTEILLVPEYQPIKYLALNNLTARGQPEGSTGEGACCQARWIWVWFLQLIVLVALYEEPEKPTSALDFLKHHLGAATPENPEIELLRLELAEMKEKYEATVEENKKLKAKLAQYEPPQEEKRAE